ncbi:MAG: M57 family metalloprotease [Pseudomonadota bacterium]
MNKLIPIVIALLTLIGEAQAQKTQTSDYFRSSLPEAEERETAQYVATGEHWPGGVVNWYYNPTDQPTYLKTEDVLASIHIAIARWAQMCSLTFNYLGTSTANRNFQDGTVDRINVIGWGYFPLALWFSSGVTYWNYSRSTSAMADADIFLNTRENWSIRDVEAVMTHEIGHMIGIEHSDVTSAIMSADPYNSYEFNRTLRGDDVAACAKLYGASPLALTNRTLNWAEKNFPSALKAGPSVTQGDGDGFVYRYYSGSNSTAGVKNGTAYYIGPDRVMQNMGPLSGYTPQVQAAGF